MSKNRTEMSVSRASSVVLIGLAALIVPQTMLRSTPQFHASWGIFLAVLVGIGAFFAVAYGLVQVRQIAPRRSLHQLAGAFLSPQTAIMVASARIVAYASVSILGTELTTAALIPFVDVSDFAPWIATAIIAFAAVVVLLRHWVGNLRWTVISTTAALAMAIVVLAVGLFFETTGGIEWNEVATARLDVLATEAKTSQGGFSAVVIASLFPTGLLLLTAERIMVPAQERRVDMQRLVLAFLPSLLVILATLYLTVVLGLPGERLALPVLSMAAAFMGEIPQYVVAVAIGLAGVAVTYTSFRQLPRLIRELAVDGLVPRRLAARDSVRSRNLILIVIAVICGIGVHVLSSARVVPITFVVATFVMGVLGAAALVSRAKAKLRSSTVSDVRRRARIESWLFRFFGILATIALGAITYMQPWWMLLDVAMLAVPGAFLVILRRGQLRIADELSADSLGAGREIPVRLRTYVLVSRVDDPTLRALDMARALRPSTLEALAVDIDPAQTRAIREDWRRGQIAVPLTVLGTPRGAARGPVIEYIRAARQQHPRDLVVVVTALVMATGAWQRFFVSHTTPAIVSELRMEPGVTIMEVPFQLTDAETEREES
ncbi:hypothetical protein J2S49_000226 [Arcanobacterium wilhelmae]|uniref:Amino acid transporter n=1 Tax=Arcanobacterium wilhelmae TaxID=1803177 RepID=A0ABT9N8X7_9ACTO|nr:hypothetical protein [Arcanobacterium wilhelmae]MDP9800150.1 hypothetical protein [Arcanobacterium wilhelmae]WFN89590.1 hypothetical protein P8A24_05120 [Arcanobacterium wilhelmae]